LPRIHLLRKTCFIPHKGGFFCSGRSGVVGYHLSAFHNKQYFKGGGQLIQCTQRESEVLALLAHGLSNKTIATCLAISPYTVRDHICRLIERHGLSNRVELATYACTRTWRIGDHTPTDVALHQQGCSQLISRADLAA
jgi:DNA-binding CsgD family transcriptional regulator